MQTPMTPLQEKYYRQGFAACEQIVAGMELPLHLRHRIITTCRSQQRPAAPRTDFETHHALLDTRTALAVQKVEEQAAKATASENHAASRATLVVNNGEAA